jgi:hypothetical protein
MRPGWVQGVGVMVGCRVAVAVGVLVGSGDGDAVGVAEGVMPGVGGVIVMRVEGTAVAARVGSGFEIISTGCEVHPIKIQMHNPKTKPNFLLPGKFTGFFFHQAFVIATPQIRFSCHGF